MKLTKRQQTLVDIIANHLFEEQSTPVSIEDAQKTAHKMLKDAISYGEGLHYGSVKSDDEIKIASESLLAIQTEAKQALASLIKELVAKARIDPFDFVESCEPDCDNVRHAYHQGQWDMATRIEAKQEEV